MGRELRRPVLKLEVLDGAVERQAKSQVRERSGQSQGLECCSCSYRERVKKEPEAHLRHAFI